jgi:hypothetical protein
VDEEDRCPQDLQGAVLPIGSQLATVEEGGEGVDRQGVTTMYATHTSTLNLRRIGALRIHKEKKRTYWTKQLARTRMRSCHSSHHCIALEIPIYSGLLALSETISLSLSFTHEQIEWLICLKLTHSPYVDIRMHMVS